jgi:uncharacterized protein (DUF427 family)
MSDDAMPQRLARAPGHWSWRSPTRPAFVAPPGPGQESVWDFPQPARLAAEPREEVNTSRSINAARIRNAVRLPETAHPPSHYPPWADIVRPVLQSAGGSWLCDWKGPARCWSLVHGSHRPARVARSHPQLLARAEAIADRVAFYAGNLERRVRSPPFTSQEGGFFGAWITPDLSRPFKGGPGSAG